MALRIYYSQIHNITIDVRLNRYSLFILFWDGLNFNCPQTQTLFERFELMNLKFNLAINFKFKPIIPVREIKE